jgi:hypothetical protein
MAAGNQKEAAKKWVSQIKAECLSLRQTQMILRKSSPTDDDEEEEEEEEAEETAESSSSSIIPPPRIIRLADADKVGHGPFSLPLHYWKGEMPMGVGLVRNEKLVGYLEISDPTKGDSIRDPIDPSKSQRILAPSDCALVWRIKDEEDEEKEPKRDEVEQPLVFDRDVFEQALADYWQIMIDAHTALSGGGGGGDESKAEFISKWMTMSLFAREDGPTLRKAVYYWFVGTTAWVWSYEARSYWAQLEGHVERMTAGHRLGRDLMTRFDARFPASERTLLAIDYMAAVSEESHVKAVRTAWLSADHVTWPSPRIAGGGKNRFSHFLVSVEAYARVYLPWKRRQQVVADYARLQSGAIPRAAIQERVYEMDPVAYDLVHSVAPPLPAVRRSTKSITLFLVFANATFINVALTQPSFFSR